MKDSKINQSNFSIKI